MPEIETVQEHCKHKDCAYRSEISGDVMCGYILYSHRPRGCKISECDKYSTSVDKRHSDGFVFMYGGKDK